MLLLLLVGVAAAIVGVQVAGVAFAAGAGRAILAEGGMSLADISIRNPVFAWMLMFGLMSFGWISFAETIERIEQTMQELQQIVGMRAQQAMQPQQPQLPPPDPNARVA
mgnify:CR=1 FL=1